MTYYHRPADDEAPEIALFPFDPRYETLRKKPASARVPVAPTVEPPPMSPAEPDEHPELAAEMERSLVSRPRGAANELHVMAWDFARRVRILYREDSETWERFVLTMQGIVQGIGVENPTERDVLMYASGWIDGARRHGLRLAPPYATSNGVSRLTRDIVREAKVVSIVGRAGENHYVAWLRRHIIVYHPARSTGAMSHDPMSSAEIAAGWISDHPEEANRSFLSVQGKLKSAMSIAFRSYIDQGHLDDCQVTSARVAGWVGCRWNPSCPPPSVVAREQEEKAARCKARCKDVETSERLSYIKPL